MPDLRSDHTIAREQENLDTHISDDLDYVISLYEKVLSKKNPGGLTSDQKNKLRDEVRNGLLASG